MLAALLSACGTVEYRPVPVKLPVPDRPTLTPVKPDAFTCPPWVILPPDWMCLTYAGYRALKSREDALRAWGLEGQAIIKANNARAAVAAPVGKPK